MNRRELIAAAGAACMVPACLPVAEGASVNEEMTLHAWLRIGPTRSGAGNHRWASIEAGSVTGTLARGVAGAGRLDWHADPATGAVEVALQCSVVQADGSLWTLSDRSCAAAFDAGMGAGLHSAPRLHRAGDPPRHPTLVGRIDHSRFAEGLLELRAFEAMRKG